MYVTGFEIVGLRGADGLRREGIDRVETLPQGRAGIATADALTLLVATLDRGRVDAALLRLGVLAPGEQAEVIEEDGLPVQVSWSEPYGAAALLAPEARRAVRVAVEVQPDPPFYGRLRDLAARDPRLVTALGQHPSLRLEIGWLFTRDHSTAALSLQHLQVGDVSFPMSGKERPGWLAAVLPDLGRRIKRLEHDEPIDAVAARLAAAALSADPGVRERFARAARTLTEPPFSLGRLELVRVGERIDACFGPTLIRSRQYGPAAAEALRLVTAVAVDTPDVLVVEAAGGSFERPAEVRSWLAEATRGDGATLEQVLFADGGADPAGDTP